MVKSRDEILAANLELHSKEASFYNALHPEIFNSHEQRRTWRDLKRVTRLLHKEAPIALDAGCGTGNIAFKLIELGFSVEGVDLSEEMLDEIQKQEIQPESLSLFRSDIDDFLKEGDTTYDLICFSSVLHHLPDYSATLRKSMARLDPFGIIYVTHEPLPSEERDNRSRLARSVKFAGLAYRAIWKRLFLRSRPRLDYSIADYHTGEGISPESLADLLASFKVQVIEIDRYSVNSTAIGAKILGMVPRSATLFSLIAQRQ